MLEVLQVRWGSISLTATLVTAALCVVGERRWPLRSWACATLPRVLSNVGLRAINWFVGRHVVVVLATLLAAHCQTQGSCLSLTDSVPMWAAVLATMAICSLLQYGLHRLLHSVPWLWRVHQIHHCDLDVDFTTGLRHHPFEALLSSTMMAVAVLVLGLHPLGVLLWLLLENMSTLYTHVNANLPAAVERAAVWVLVTPGMHRVHHARDIADSNSNFGTVFSCWDRLFGSYRSQSRASATDGPLGVDGWRDPTRLGLPDLLVMPFRSNPRDGVEDRSRVVSDPR